MANLPMTNETVRLFPHDYVMKAMVLPLIPSWIKPNHVTVFRLVATPIVLDLLLFKQYDWGVPAFLFVAFTDAIDGSLARVRKQITPWGTFYDPVADKILVGSVLILIVFQYINVWFGLLIILMEVLIAFGGFYRKWKHIPSSANVFGKIKMCLQVVAVGFLLIAVWQGIDLFVHVSVGTFSVALIFAVISLVTYGI
ncbi:MAG: CDP-alcohol phosphatidyltransferase family protein [bacterium]|nr:CDP-alcohol phosphatidyltransferase family protein [bacterium]